MYSIYRPDAGRGVPFQFQEGKLPIAPALIRDRSEATIYGVGG